MKLEIGNRFSLAEYKDPREFGILTQPDSDGMFWVRVRCQWVLVKPYPYNDGSLIVIDVLSIEELRGK